MSRAPKSYPRSLNARILRSKSRVGNIAKGRGIASTRADPAQSDNDDKKISSRLGGALHVKCIVRGFLSSVACSQGTYFKSDNDIHPA